MPVTWPPKRKIAEHLASASDSIPILGHVRRSSGLRNNSAHALRVQARHSPSDCMNAPANDHSCSSAAPPSIRCERAQRRSVLKVLAVPWWPASSPRGSTQASLPSCACSRRGDTPARSARRADVPLPVATGLPFSMTLCCSCPLALTDLDTSSPASTSARSRTTRSTHRMSGPRVSPDRLRIAGAP